MTASALNIRDRFPVLQVITTSARTKSRVSGGGRAAKLLARNLSAKNPQTLGLVVMYLTTAFDLVNYCFHAAHGWRKGDSVADGKQRRRAPNDSVSAGLRCDICCAFLNEIDDVLTHTVSR